jgi:hypothetical protein
MQSAVPGETVLLHKQQKNKAIYDLRLGYFKEDMITHKFKFALGKRSNIDIFFRMMVEKTNRHLTVLKFGDIDKNPLTDIFIEYYQGYLEACSSVIDSDTRNGMRYAYARTIMTLLHLLEKLTDKELETVCSSHTFASEWFLACEKKFTNGENK